MSKAHVSKASAQPAVPVTNPNQPAAPKPTATTNHPASAKHCLIISEDALYQVAPALHEAAETNLTKAQWAETFVAGLKRAGTEVSCRQPYLLLRMQSQPDGLPQAIELAESIDWTLFEVVAQAIHAASLHAIPAARVNQECRRHLPAIQEEARHTAIHYMQGEAQQILADMNQCARETAKELIGEAKGRLAKTIPYEDYEILEALLRKATHEAFFMGLNPHQLFVDDRLGLLLKGTEELQAYENLPVDRREAMRSWIARTLCWTTYYPAKASQPEGRSR